MNIEDTDVVVEALEQISNYYPNYIAMRGPSAMTDKTETDDFTPLESLANRLIDVWIADQGKKIPWAKAVQITAIVTKMPDSERDRLLRLGDIDGSCEMCGRHD